jgi:uncharacterized membrane protein
MLYVRRRAAIPLFVIGKFEFATGIRRALLWTFAFSSNLYPTTLSWLNS